VPKVTNVADVPGGPTGLRTKGVLDVAETSLCVALWPGCFGSLIDD